MEYNLIRNDNDYLLDIRYKINGRFKPATFFEPAETIDIDILSISHYGNEFEVTEKELFKIFEAIEQEVSNDNNIDYEFEFD